MALVFAKSRTTDFRQIKSQSNRVTNLYKLLAAISEGFHASRVELARLLSRDRSGPLITGKIAGEIPVPIQQKLRLQLTLCGTA